MKLAMLMQEAEAETSSGGVAGGGVAPEVERAPESLPKDEVVQGESVGGDQPGVPPGEHLDAPARRGA